MVEHVSPWWIGAGLGAGFALYGIYKVIASVYARYVGWRNW